MPIPPLVSVMMPARNAAKFLPATIESIQSQTYTNWELIFVDDGSTDNTLEIVRGFALLDQRIRVFAVEFGGRGRARNECLKNIRGEYLAVCDADDISFRDRFEKQVSFLQDHPEISVVGSAWVPFATDSPLQCKPVRSFPIDSNDIQEAFSNGKMRFHNATAMLRCYLLKEFGGYNAELKRAQDYEYFSRMSRKGILFAALSEPLLFYRQESEIPSIGYFCENGMYMAYADQILDGHVTDFESFSISWMGKFWWCYYNIKYLYFFAKIYVLNRAGF